MTTDIEPREPGAQRVDPSRVQVVGLDTPLSELIRLIDDLTKQYRRRGPAEAMADLGAAVMAGFAEGVARANAIDVEPVGDSECKPPSALTVRK